MKSTTIFMLFFMLIFSASCGVTPTETAQPSPAEAVKTATKTIPPPTATATAEPSTPTPTDAPPTITPTQPTSTPWPTYPPPMPITYFLGFNTAKPPFDDVEVRRAFARAIDRQAIVDALLDEYELQGLLPASSLVPPDIWPDGRNRYGEIGLLPDPAADPVEPWWDTSTTIVFAFAEGSEQDAQILQAQWLEHFGVEVELVSYDFETYEQQLDSAAPHIFYYGWYADYASPYNFLADAMQSTSRWSNWSDGKYDQLVAAALKSGDANRSISLFEEAERVLCEEEAAIAPLQHYYYAPP